MNREGEDGKTLRLKKQGSTFLICFCVALILFYIIASILVHCAYREWKGQAEDCAGGSITFTDGNFLHYGVIDKREDDAIEELKEKKKRKKERKRLEKEEARKSKED